MAGANANTQPDQEVGARTDSFAAQASVRRLFIPVFAVFAVVASIGVVTINWNSWFARAIRQSTTDATISADISNLSAQISGVISSFPVADYQRVTKGQLIAQIDPRTYQAAVSVAKANLESAKATLENLSNQVALQNAVIEAARANARSAKAKQAQTAEEYRRQQTLEGATSRQLVQQAQAADLEARAAVESADAAIDQQQAQLRVLKGQEPLLRAKVKAAQGALDTAQINQGFSRIHAPFDGVLGKRQVHVGDFVTAGSGIVSEIPLPDIYVVANYKETQLSQMKVGDTASIRVDTFPGKTLSGHVEDISPASGSVFALLPPDNASGNYTKVVQRIPVKIAIDPEQPLVQHLRPGMSVTVTVDTSDETGR
ncbi:HlyD family secretion protein [Martelella mediterranea]|uniref:Multidrug resistance protein MdtN n=1 Tax=Martelella mediterranea DSM 17316 TaxID=1122214 RepID=A0A1U9Z3I2_9HYPH|nr:HlyD family secretion protein [Martelella mediterranea]AQZ52228.1 Multidrug resistance protein MdtN [Martelella mediterranea DSM 17316]